MRSSSIHPRSDRTASGRGLARRRARRPLTRLQEIAVLALMFAAGAALQVAFVLHAAPVTP